MTARTGTRGAAILSACAAAITTWDASCAGPDFSTAAPLEAGTSDAEGDAGEELVIINCPGCWDTADATADVGAASGDAAAGETEEAGLTQEGGDGPNGPELSLLAGALGGPGNADGVGMEARFRDPDGIAYDMAGNVFISSPDQTIRRLSLATGTVTTIAGSPGVSGSADGVGSFARFHCPKGLAVDNSGNLFVSDGCSNTIRKIVLASGAVTTIAGTAQMGGASDGVGPAASFNGPGGVVADGAGNLYVLDVSNSTIRKIVTDTGVVSTIAGSPGVTGTADGTGSAARFNRPAAAALDGSGNLYVADAHNFAIRKVALTTAAVTTLVGSAGMEGYVDGLGSAARFNLPNGLTSDGVGDLFVVETGANTIRRIVISAGSVTTIAGAAGGNGWADGVGPTATFSFPVSIAADLSANLFVTDYFNHAIRKLALATDTASTLAGTPPQPGNSDGVGAAARFNGPTSVCTDHRGNLYVSDEKNATVRKVVLATGAVSTLAASSSASDAADAGFGSPSGLAADGSMLYVADSSASVIRSIDSTNGIAATLVGLPGIAGSVDGVGAAARFVTPCGLATDGGGNLYVTDCGDNTIRKVILATAVVTTLAGSPGMQGSTDGTGSGARFFTPKGIAADGAGNVYIADNGSHTIRQVVTATGVVTTIAGSPGIAGSNDGSASTARFNAPSALSLDGRGSLYVADTGNATIRKIDLASGGVTTWIGVAGQLGVKLGALPASLNSPQGIVALSTTALAIVDQAENAVLLAR